MELTLQQWALRYASIGWAVFPVRPGEKTPLTKNGCLDASSDLQVVSDWWNADPGANIGMATGTPSRTWVLDVDSRAPSGGITGYGALERLQIDNGPLPRTLVSSTGGGGTQYFWRLPINRDVRNRVNVRADDDMRSGLDVRGTGGYVILPPSIHPSGMPYNWLFREAVSDAPDWLYAILSNPEQDLSPSWTPTEIPIDLSKAKRYAQAALQKACDRIRESATGGRHFRIVEEASNIGRFAAAGLIEEELVAKCLIEAGVASGKPASEVRRAVWDQIRWAQSYPKVPEGA